MGVLYKRLVKRWWGRICSSTGSCSGNAAPECWRRIVLPRLQRVWELLMANLQILQNHGTKLQQLRLSEEERRSRRRRRKRRRKRRRYLYN
jgi:hypothetical protein